MTWEQRIDAVRDFLNENVCSDLSLKVPNDNDMYQVDWRSPVAYSTFLPPKNKLPAEINQPVPSVVVMPIRDEESLNEGTLLLHLVFAIWDPGTRLPGAPKKRTPEFLELDNDGWRALCTFTERAKMAIIAERSIGDMELTYPVRRGFFNEEDSTPDLRPYYMAWMDLSFRYGPQPTYNQAIHDFMS